MNFIKKIILVPRRQNTFNMNYATKIIIFQSKVYKVLVFSMLEVHVLWQFCVIPILPHSRLVSKLDLISDVPACPVHFLRNG